MESKSELRELMRRKRRNVSAETRRKVSEAICETLLLDEDIASASSPSSGALAVYMSSPCEIDLTLLVSEALKKNALVVTPRWNGNDYDLAVIESLDAENFRTGPMGILEPKKNFFIPSSEVGAWIVPGLAFTSDGKRLGYGGGWYDRLLLSSERTSLKTGVAYSFQIVDDIDTLEHDIPVDRVVTELTPRA